MAVIGTLNWRLQKVQIPVTGTAQAIWSPEDYPLARSALSETAWREAFFFADRYFKTEALARAIVVVL
jgi:glycogen synthase